MKLRKYMTIAALSLILSGSAQSINPITQAMLDGYASLLAQNPKDYLTLYERASQYYRLSKYDLALNDIKKAIEFTPAKEKSQLASEYALCADIYTQSGDYSQALSAVNSALSQTPDSYPLLYMKGNICLYLKDYTSAASCFQAMRRINPRSQESVIGLAKIAVLQNNYSKANGYIADAEKLDPSNYLTYCRIGDLHKEMGMPRQAGADYISAFCLSSSSDRPMSSMLALASTNYDAVMEAVDYALTQTSNTVPLNFLKANIALNSGKYAEAYESYQQLLTDDSQTGVLAPSLANVCLGTGNLADADKYANIALQASNNARNNLTKARIEESAGNTASALLYANNAMRTDGQSVDAIIETASLQIAQGEYDAAMQTLGNAILLDPANADFLLMRGLLQKKFMNRPDAAKVDFQRVIALPVTDDKGSLHKAIAQSLSGLTMDAQSVIAPLEAKASVNPDVAILVAQFYNVTGDRNNAAKFKAMAKENGFEDEYILNYSLNPVTTLKGL